MKEKIEAKYYISRSSLLWTLLSTFTLLSLALLRVAYIEGYWKQFLINEIALGISALALFHLLSPPKNKKKR